MFSSRGLFQSVPCPDGRDCIHPTCIFSHSTGTYSQPTLQIPFKKPQSLSQSSSHPTCQEKISSSSRSVNNVSTKRTVLSPNVPSSHLSASGEPPRKLVKLGSARGPIAVPTAVSVSSNGVPTLNIRPFATQVPLHIRQTMLKTLYDHFVILYHAILPQRPGVAAEHALKQEEEVYSKTNKHTYRNCVIQTAAALKRREFPDSVSHPSVGTEGDLAAREEARKSLRNLRLTRADLVSLIMSVDDMQKWGYFIAVPDTPGGEEPTLEGKRASCERCGIAFTVKNSGSEELKCMYHWGKPYSTRIGGEKTRVYKCCSKPVSEPGGCTLGPHVFYETQIEDLHRRHPFSRLPTPETAPEALDIAALDCEMVYTTGGSRVARVSIVDGVGEKVFDELVKMDDGVEILDYITRFSGITADLHAKATLTLADVRSALAPIINSDTVLVGHALDNDLKTLRIIHDKCVDTAIVFPHPAGPPYRRALRDLVREHLSLLIQQGGGSTGHSSLEDAIATLDLLRWHVMKNRSTLTTKL